MTDVTGFGNDGVIARRRLGKSTLVAGFATQIGVAVVESSRYPGDTGMAAIAVFATGYMFGGFTLCVDAVMAQLTGFFTVVIVQGIKIDKILVFLSKGY
jgi:hypothetical protein